MSVCPYVRIRDKHKENVPEVLCGKQTYTTPKKALQLRTDMINVGSSVKLWWRIVVGNPIAELAPQLRWHNHLSPLQVSLAGLG